ncbi:MAG: hypothetical protein OEN20_05275, partial [Gammaproteobacteria bacterium]|nr:hypothetical protein [Gammaproteobacteria bacterium]
MKLKFSAAAAVVLCSVYASHSPAQQVDIVPMAEDDRRAMLGDEQVLRFVPGQIIVKYRQRTAEAEARLRASGLEGHVTTTSGGEYIYRLPVATMTTLSAAQAERTVQDAVREMAARDDVEYAQPNYLVHIVREPNDPGYALQWHYRNNGSGSGQSPGGINLPDAWDVTTGNPAVVVAVLDTGILPNHPDISGSS